MTCTVCSRHSAQALNNQEPADESMRTATCRAEFLLIFGNLHCNTSLDGLRMFQAGKYIAHLARFTQKHEKEKGHKK